MFRKGARIFRFVDPDRRSARLPLRRREETDPVLVR